MYERIQREDRDGAARPQGCRESRRDHLRKLPLPRDRLGLAAWTTAPGHPLTARVVVNRLWQMFFGRGLVVSSEDFGAQGAFPDAPDLLDWLAVELVESSTAQVFDLGTSGSGMQVVLIVDEELDL